MNRAAFWDGVRDNAPFLPGAVAIGLIAGATTVTSGFSVAASIIVSGSMFAGNAQIVAMQLFAASAPLIIVILAAAVVNLRHLMYGMSLGPHIRTLPLIKRIAIGYFMVDNAYALSIRKFDAMNDGEKWGYYMGISVVGWTVWTLACVAGAFIGARVPASWQLDVAPSLGMLSLIVPNLRDRPSILAAVLAAILSTLLNPLPLRVGLLIAGFIAMLFGLWIESRQTGAKR